MAESRSIIVELQRNFDGIKIIFTLSDIQLFYPTMCGAFHPSGVQQFISSIYCIIGHRDV